MKLIVIGAVAAGMSAASKLRRLDPSIEITVYEKGTDVSYGACGLPYYLSGEIDSDQTLVARTPEAFREKGIDLKLEHEVTAVDSESKRVTVMDHVANKPFTASYDRLLIATGADAIRLPVAGSALKNIHTLSSLADGRTLHAALREKTVKKVALIGAGYIGIEVSEALRTLGLDVVVIEQEDHVLPKFSALVGRTVADTLKEEGVELRLGESLIRYEGEDTVEKVITDKGTIDVDLVIEAIGVKPNTAYLDQTGIETLKNGAIIVNDAMETSVPHIYAAGDCAAMPNRLKGGHSYLPLGTHANKAGRIVAEQIGGNQARFGGVIGSSVLKAFDLEVARTGLTDSEGEASETFDVDTVEIKAPDRSGYYPGATPVQIKLYYDKKTCRIVGAEMVGKAGVAHRINVVATAISAGMTAREMAELDMAYAPPFSPVWDPLQIACNQINCD